MSAFGFTDDTPAENTGETTEFAFDQAGQASAGPTSADSQPAEAKERPSLKKAGPRVIGSKKVKKDSKKVPSRFAKKSSEPSTDAAMPKSSPVPAQITGTPQKEAVKDAEKSAFDFASEPAAPQNPTDETSAFSFGDAPAQNNADSSEFTFGQAEQPNQKQPEVTTSVQVNQNLHINKEFADLEPDFAKFATSLTDLQKSAEEAMKAYESIKAEITKKEADLSNATNSENFSLAEKLSQSINDLKSKLSAKKADYADSIMKSMELASEAPSLLSQNELKTEQSLPSLKENLEETNKKLTSLNEEQQKDSITVDIERKKIAEQVDEMKKPVESLKSQIDATSKNIEERVAQAAAPFKDEIKALTDQKDSHQKEIESLLAQIEQHKQEISKLRDQIRGKESEMSKAISAFDSEKQKLATDKKSYKATEDNFNNSVKKLESPFQSLVDAVEKRAKQIEQTQKASEEAKVKIETIEKDMAASHDANDILTTLCGEFSSYYDSRSTVSDKLEFAKAQVTASEQKRDKSSAQANELQTKRERCNKFITESNDKQSTLETAKKAAVASKNFRVAQQASNQLKELSEQIADNQKMMDESSKLLEEAKASESEAVTAIAKAKADAEALRQELVSLDFSVYQTTIQTLAKLFESSSFSSRILKPLKDLIQYALDNAEKPEVKSPEELQKKIEALNKDLEAAVAVEDFGKADQVQVQIDVLTKELETAKAK